MLITPDDEIINLVNGTKEGNERIKIKEGVNRIKLVGKKPKGKLSLKSIQERILLLNGWIETTQGMGVSPSRSVKTMIL